MGDYGVGGSRELSLGLRMKSYESRHDANMLVTLGDNDYLRALAVLGELAEELRLDAALRATRGRGAREPRLRDRPRAVRAEDARDAGAVLHAAARRTATLLPGLEQRLEPAEGVARAAALRFDRHVEDRALPPPPYTCGGHSGNTHVVRDWVPLFERYGVQLVLSGHDHNYQRFAPRNGVTYVVHGGGAARRSTRCAAVRARIRGESAPSTSTGSSTSPRRTANWTYPLSTCAAGPPITFA